MAHINLPLKPNSRFAQRFMSNQNVELEASTKSHCNQKLDKYTFEPFSPVKLNGNSTNFFSNYSSSKSNQDFGSLSNFDPFHKSSQGVSEKETANTPSINFTKKTNYNEVQKNQVPLATSRKHYKTPEIGRTRQSSIFLDKNFDSLVESSKSHLDQSEQLSHQSNSNFDSSEYTLSRKNMKVQDSNLGSQNYLAISKNQAQITNMNGVFYIKCISMNYPSLLELGSQKLIIQAGMILTIGSPINPSLVFRIDEVSNNLEFDKSCRILVQNHQILKVSYMNCHHKSVDISTRNKKVDFDDSDQSNSSWVDRFMQLVGFKKGLKLTVLKGLDLLTIEKDKKAEAYTVKDGGETFSTIDGSFSFEITNKHNGIWLFDKIDSHSQSKSYLWIKNHSHDRPMRLNRGSKLVFGTKQMFFDM
jgi:hypothetical protein